MTRAIQVNVSYADGADVCSLCVHRIWSPSIMRMVRPFEELCGGAECLCDVWTHELWVLRRSSSTHHTAHSTARRNAFDLALVTRAIR